jgi:hypothetical protein
VALKEILGILVSGLLVGALLGVGAYAVDYGVGSSVVGKGSDGSGYYVVAELDLGGLTVKKYVPLAGWGAIKVGNYAVYHVRSGVTDVFASKGGRLLFSG